MIKRVPQLGQVGFPRDGGHGHRDAQIPSVVQDGQQTLQAQYKTDSRALICKTKANSTASKADIRRAFPEEREPFGASLR